MSDTDRPDPLERLRALARKTRDEITPWVHIEALIDEAQADRQRMAADLDKERGYNQALRADVAEGWGDTARARDIAVALEQEVARVAELHQQYEDPGGPSRCGECEDIWPCLTRRALDGGGS